MTNPVLLLSGAGMIAVGILSVSYWARRTHVTAAPFVFGAAFWAAAIAPKVAMDLGFGGDLNRWLDATFGPITALGLLSLYLGVRTGAFESGFSYLAFQKTRLRSSTLNDAAAFGLGFGATEAILIGVGSLLSILPFLLNPSLIEHVPEAQRRLLLQNLNAPSSIVLAPIIERAFAVMIHLLATLLVYVAAIKARLRYFWLSFLYKTVTDALVPSLSLLITQTNLSPIAIYEAEIPVAVIGLIGLLGTRYLRKRFF